MSTIDPQFPARQIVLDYWLHTGRTEADFIEAEAQTCSASQCEFISGVGYVCHTDEEEHSLHALKDELDFVAEMAMFIIEHPLATELVSPTDDAPLPEGARETHRITVRSYLTTEGGNAYVAQAKGEAPSSSYLGLLVMAQRDVLGWGDK